MISKEQLQEIRIDLVNQFSQKIDVLTERRLRDLNLIIDDKLNEWFNSNIRELVDKEIKAQFEKMMIIKFGENK